MRLREGRGVGIPGHSPDIPLIPHPLLPASAVPGKSRSPRPAFVSAAGLVKVGLVLLLSRTQGSWPFRGRLPALRLSRAPRELPFAP